MKYIDAEKLIAEIERRKKQDVTFRERNLLIDMENAITSLQQEQPEVDLEKEAFKEMEQFCCDWMPITKRFGLQMFKAGYELGLNARK